MPNWAERTTADRPPSSGGGVRWRCCDPEMGLGFRSGRRATLARRRAEPPWRPTNSPPWTPACALRRSKLARATSRTMCAASSAATSPSRNRLPTSPSAFARSPPPPPLSFLFAFPLLTPLSAAGHSRRHSSRSHQQGNLRKAHHGVRRNDPLLSSLRCANGGSVARPCKIMALSSLCDELPFDVEICI